MARSELDIQRALPDVQVTDHHGNSVITTADGAESAIPLSVVGGVNEGSRSILKDSGRYIVGALSSRVGELKNIRLEIILNLFSRA